MLRFLPVIIKPLAVILFVSFLVVQWVKVDNSKYDDSDFISIVYQCSELNKYDHVPRQVDIECEFRKENKQRNPKKVVP